MITLLKKLFYLNKEKINSEIKPVNDIEAILGLADKINSSLFKQFNNKDNSAIVIRCLYPRLTIYNHKLKEVNAHLSKNKIIYNAWCLEVEQSLSVCEFFLDDKNNYIDEIDEIEKFKLLSIVFLSFYYEHSLSVEVGEHNRRVLTYFKDSLINTIQDLTEIV